MWREFLSLAVNRKLILHVPVAEIAELQVMGKLKNGGNALDVGKEQKIKVPFSFDDSNHPKEFINVWRGSYHSKSVCYRNALGSVTASAFNSEVLYWR